MLLCSCWATSSTHVQHSLLFLTFFLINISTYYYTFFNFSPPFYLFIFPLLYTLISFFLYLFIFLYFLFFLFPPLTINLQFYLSFYTYFLTHKRLFSFSFSLSKFCFSFFGGIFYFSCISTLVDNFLHYLKLYFVLIWLSYVFKLLYFFFSLIS